MVNFTDKLLVELDLQLKVIEQETRFILRRSEKCIAASKNTFDKLKIFIVEYKFSTAEEEISFFKNIKPQFTSQLIFNLMIYHMETRKPSGGSKILKKYWTKELDNLKRYFDNNSDFYKYHRGSSNYLDHKYFMRGKQDIQLIKDSYFFEVDPRFSTTHDLKVSEILAHDKLQIHIEKELDTLERRDKMQLPIDFSKSGLEWTESKTALIELIYGLHSQGSISNGKADLKQIAEHFEQMFNIDLGDYYRTYLEIRIRKTGRTKFLASIQESLTKKMDELDER